MYRDNKVDSAHNTSMYSAPLTTSLYLRLFIIFFLPVVNFILIPKWAFSRKGNINRRNYARACLVIYGIGIAIEISVYLYMTRISGH